MTAAFERRNYVFIDEMGSHLSFTRRYGRAAPGQRVGDEVPGERGQNVSTSGAIALDGVRTGLSVTGAINGEPRLFFVAELLVPTLKRGEIVVLDNCSIHKQEEIAEALEAVGAWVLFLPPYSPDLNPIENCWSKVKALLRSLKPRSFDALQTALVEAFAALTTQDMRGWFGHCGYGGALT